MKEFPAPKEAAAADPSAMDIFRAFFFAFCFLGDSVSSCGSGNCPPLFHNGKKGIGLIRIWIFGLVNK